MDVRKLKHITMGAIELFEVSTSSIMMEIPFFFLVNPIREIANNSTVKLIFLIQQLIACH